MKILLLGGNGQVGRELRRSLVAVGQVIVATRDGEGADAVADFEQPELLAGLIDASVPDVVVNAAAYTAVDKAETDVDAAFGINSVAPGVIAQACVKHGALLVHYSTDYVFDGKAIHAYREDDPTHPLSDSRQRRAPRDPAHGVGVCGAGQEFPADDAAAGKRTQ